MEETLLSAGNTPANDSVHSIADVERALGIGKDTLRVWERRYGFPAPHRDASGERRYSEPDVQRLRLVKRLLDQGLRPGRLLPAAGQGLEALQAVGASLVAAPRPSGEAGTVGVLGAAGLVSERPWLAWLQADETEKVRHGLRQHLLARGLASTMEELIAPLAVQVGEAWMQGRLSVYQEHWFTHMVQALLREAIAQALATQASPPAPPRVVMATMPLEQHAIGLLMAECFLVLQGCDCRSLGPGTPVDEVVAAIKRMDADAVAISFSAHAPPNDVLRSLNQLRERLAPSTWIWVGGGAHVLRSRRCPAGVTVLRQARDLQAEVQRWRAQAAV